MDIASIATAYNGLKSTLDIFQDLTKLKIASDSTIKINEAVKKVADAQQTLYLLRDELFKLQDENRELKTTIHEFKLQNDQLSLYELFQSVGGAMVYKYKSEPVHFACPSCFSKKSIEILQNLDNGFGDYSCSGCKSTYAIGLKQPAPHIPSAKNYWD